MPSQGMDELDDDTNKRPVAGEICELQNTEIQKKSLSTTGYWT